MINNDTWLVFVISILSFNTCIALYSVFALFFLCFCSFFVSSVIAVVIRILDNFIIFNIENYVLFLFLYVWWLLNETYHRIHLMMGNGFVANPKVVLNWILFTVYDTTRWVVFEHQRNFLIEAIEPIVTKILAV